MKTSAIDEIQMFLGWKRNIVKKEAVFMFYSLDIQKLQQVQDPVPGDQLKLKPLTKSQARLPNDQVQPCFEKQPIFRITHDESQLSYQLSDEAYRIHSQLLSHTKIKPQDREKLKSWMLSETQNMYERETYAYASRFLDMFFSKGHKVPRSSFQVLGIACLMLAAKVNERRVPSISFQVFDRNQIFSFQKGLLQIFKYKVFPVTYVTLSQLLFYFWDNYNCERHSFKDIKYLKEGVQSIKKVRTILETLDCMDLVHETLSIPLNTLVLSVFYVENRRICLLNWKNQQKNYAIQSEQQCPFDKIYERFMLDFFKSLKTSLSVFNQIEIDSKIILYTMAFSRINPKIRVSTKYRHFMFEINRQTYNPQITELAQSYISKRVPK